MLNINIFNSTEHLEPKCKSCGAKIDYGVTTTFDDIIEAHRCNDCEEEIS